MSDDPKTGPVYPPTSAKRSGWAYAGSLLLHLAVLCVLEYVGLTHQSPPPDEPLAILVQLVRLGDQTAAPTIDHQAQTPPQSPAVQTKVHRSSKTVQGPSHLSNPQQDAAPPKTTANEVFDEQLKKAAESLAESLSGRGQGQQKTGSARLGKNATYSLKDYVRAQIQQHWNFNVAALGAARWVISIHVVLDVDGRVGNATAVEDPRLINDPSYQALSKSARDAALIASPIAIPEGLSPAERDMVLDFDPRRSLR